VSILIGVDPGKTGGVAMLDGYEGVTRVYAMPDSDWETWELFSELARTQGEKRAVLEKVNSFAQGRTSAFTFGRQFGFVQACLIACRIPFEEVTPQKWQKALGCASTKDLTYAQRKKQLQDMARKLYPHVDVSLSTADALLLAHYLRRLENGNWK